MVCIRCYGSSAGGSWVAWKTRAILAIFGFGLVMFTFVGVSALLGGHHGFKGANSLMGPNLS